MNGKIGVKEWAKKELGTVDNNPGLAAGIKYYQPYDTMKVSPRNLFEYLKSVQQSCVIRTSQDDSEVS